MAAVCKKIINYKLKIINLRGALSALPLILSVAKDPIEPTEVRKSNGMLPLRLRSGSA